MQVAIERLGAIAICNGKRGKVYWLANSRNLMMRKYLDLPEIYPTQVFGTLLAKETQAVLEKPPKIQNK